MTDDRVTIHYPTGEVETISASPTGEPSEWELRSHAFLMPLGPGDVVKVDNTMTVVSVVRLDPQWIYHVDLHLPADFTAGPLPGHHPAVRAAEQLADEWARDTPITLLTTFTFVVSTKSARWFDEKVATNKYVSQVTLTRTPDVQAVPIEVKLAL